MAILESEPESLTKSLDAVPATLERIVRKTLKKDRDERYSTMSELASELDTFCAGLSGQSNRTILELRQRNKPLGEHVRPTDRTRMAPAFTDLLDC